MLDFTTATGEQRKKAYDAIAKELGDDQFFTTKELDVLPKILAPMEQVLSFSSGLMEGNTWLIVLTDQRVMLVDKGMVFGLKQISIQLEDIVAIEGQTGLFFGNISVSTAAGPREIRNVWKRTVNTFINKVNAARSARRSGTQLLSPGTAAADPTDPDVLAATHRPVQEPVAPRYEPETPAPPVTRSIPHAEERPRREEPRDMVQVQPVQDRSAAAARLARLLNAGSIGQAEHDAAVTALGR
jgi:hypothetical protein